MTKNTGKENKRPMPNWKLLIKLIRYKPWTYAVFCLMETMFFAVFPQLSGLVLQNIFNQLSGEETTLPGVWGLLGIFIALAASRSLAFSLDVYVYYIFYYTSSALLRHNMFAHILDRPGANALPGTSAEAISHFRDDVHEVSDFLVEFFVLIAFGIFSIAALITMIKINLIITLVSLTPLIFISLIANFALNRVQFYREERRKNAGKVTGFIGDLFGNVQAVKLATAENHILTEFKKYIENLKNSSIRDRLFTEILNKGIFRNIVNITTGVVLLFAAKYMQQGTFSVGNLALFVYYIGFITEFSATIGEKLARSRQLDVSYKRIQNLMEGATPGKLVEHVPIHISGKIPEVTQPQKNAAHRFHDLSVRKLTYRYPENGGTHGIENINFDLKKGALTIITGRIGSGKSTLLKTLLGLVPKDSGEIYWNNDPVNDPANFFIPPRCAFTPQTPVFFSETLKENILMGLIETETNLEEAIYQSVMEKDIQGFENGLNTLIGRKGIKISGGQRQRTAAARMLIRQAELMVFDDISSSLDVNTEKIFWDRIISKQDVTCLAVSHRRLAFARAQQILVMDQGKIIAAGKLQDLLESCTIFQQLWFGEYNNDQLN
ncbi:MAG: ABC transporter ATP-binding protein [Anaerolineaceae bacterium]|nr:ABC transporter ATP-binding protein [Anaerolineaceae bacterium]